MKHSFGMPSEKWQMGDKDVNENITLRWVKGRYIGRFL